MDDIKKPDLTYEGWFRAQQGKPYEFMWDFGKDAWAAAEHQWKSAVIDQLVICGILTQEHEASARYAVQSLVNYEIEMALDPQISDRAEKLTQTLQPEVERLKRAAEIDTRLIKDLERKVRRLEEVELAAMNLVAQRGRHNTQIAYENLAAVLKGQRDV